MNRYDNMTREMLSNHAQLVYTAAKSHVVKLVCQRVDSQGALEDCGFFNGFLYHDKEPLILTTKHILGFGGAVKYIAKYYDGTVLQGEAECSLRKASDFEDVLLLTARWRHAHAEGEGEREEREGHLCCPTCDNVSPRTPRPLARVCCVGDIAYVVSFGGRGEHQLSFTDGMVDFVGLREITVKEACATSHADNMFSGCPVFDMDGFLIGMVCSTKGDQNQTMVVVPSTTIDAFLRESPPAPGLRDKL